MKKFVKLVTTPKVYRPFVFLLLCGVLYVLFFKGERFSPNAIHMLR